jgi:hypothetical protein
LGFERNCRPIVIRLFKKLWTRQDVSLEGIARFASAIPFRTQSNEHSLDVLTSFFVLVREILLVRTDQIPFFVGFVRMITDFLARTDLTAALLHSVLRFCAVVAPRLDDVSISALAAAIQRAEGDNPSEATYAALLEILTFRSSAKVISRAEASRLLVAAFLRSPNCPTSSPSLTRSARSPSRARSRSTM